MKSATVATLPNTKCATVANFQPNTEHECPEAGVCERCLEERADRLMTASLFARGCLLLARRHPLTTEVAQ